MPSRELDSKRKRYIILGNLFLVTMVVIGFASLGILVINAVQGAETRNTLIDCVEPSGECFREGQSRTGDLVKNLNDFTVAAAVCAVDVRVLNEPNVAKRTVLAQRCIEEVINLDPKE